MPQDSALIVFSLVVMVLSISLHDCAQAWMANRLGDPTARMLGRVTMNPAMHFDTFGMVASPLLSIFLFHNLLPYGWGKQVPMTYRNFPRKNGEILAVLAGPGAQFLAAFVAVLALAVIKHAVPGGADAVNSAILTAYHMPAQGLAGASSLFPLLLLLYLCVMMNLLLCVFNLLPMPFLDGGKILGYFLPYNAARAFEKYSFYFLIAFFLLGGTLVGMVFGPLLGLFTMLLERL